MGSPEEGTTAGKPSNPKLTAAPPAAAVTPPTATVASPVMMAYPDWGAYYASGAAASGAAFFPPAAWGGQPLIPTYGGQIPFSPVYYAHPSVSAGTPYLNQESEGNGKEQVSANKSIKAATQKSVDGGKVTSGSADDDATQSGETGSDGSSATRDESTDPQNSSTSRKRTSNEAFAEGEAAQGGIKYCSATSESSHGGRVPKLPVSAPGRAALPGLATNLNIGMDAWNAGSGPVKLGQNAANFAPLMPGREGVMPEHQWMQKDERELKRERRKQSNRESARRSRLRKQQECEELARKVAELKNENIALKVEVEQLTRSSEELRAENASLMASHPDLPTDEERAFLHGRGSVSASEGISDSNPSTMLTVGECRPTMNNS